MPPKKRSSKSSQPNAVTACIDNLPPELLAEIFQIHVLVNHDTPVNLLPVCHQWNAVASETGSLWSRILYGDINEADISDATGCLDEVVDQLRSMVRCSDINSLSHALMRVKQSKFELTIFPTVSAPKFSKNQAEQLSRFKTFFATHCRVLRIMGHDAPTFLSPLLRNLRGVEECRFVPFELSEQSEQPKLDLVPILLDVIKHSSNLQRLSFAKESNIFDGAGKIQLPRSLVTLGVRITRECIEDDRIFTALDSVEEALFAGSDSDRACHDVHLAFSSEKPNLTKLSFYWAILINSPHVFQQITYLSVRHCSYSRGHNDEKLQFPALKTLVFEKPWEVLAAISAPVLQELRICGECDPWYADYVTVSPEVLHVEQYRGELDFLGLAMDKWKQVRELNLTIADTAVSTPKELADVLVEVDEIAGNGSEEETRSEKGSAAGEDEDADKVDVDSRDSTRTEWALFPKLEYLTILYPVRRQALKKKLGEAPRQGSKQSSRKATADQKSSSQRNNKKEREAAAVRCMRLVATARTSEEERGTNLRKFMLGEFTVRPKYVDYLESRRWWDIKWTELVQE